MTLGLFIGFTLPAPVSASGVLPDRMFCDSLTVIGEQNRQVQRMTNQVYQLAEGLAQLAV